MSSTFASSDMPPPTSGMHLIGACYVHQVDRIIHSQHSKRRGGPKKVRMMYRMIDPSNTRSVESTKLHTIEWKVISNKNFSNNKNITQYERNPYGSEKTANSLLVIHGQRNSKTGQVSNTVGVNFGRDVSLHPRFLLSSGKGEEGARSSFLFYHTNDEVHIEIQKLWIAHSELKITVEQYSEDESVSDADSVPMVTFDAKYKHVYEDSASSTSSSSSSSPVSTPKPTPLSKSLVSAPWRVSAPSNIVRSVTTALPPAVCPPAVVKRLISRKRSFVEDATTKQEERAVKREYTEEANNSDSPVQAEFSGFDSLDMFPLVVDEPMVSDEMLLEEPNTAGCDTPSSCVSGDETPRLGLTPPPFLHGDAEPLANSFEMEMMLFEQQLSKYEPIQQTALYNEQQQQYSQQALSTQQPCDLPIQLKTAHIASGNPFSFAPFASSEVLQGSEQLKTHFSLPINLALQLHKQSSPLPPALFDIDAMQCRRKLPPTASKHQYQQHQQLMSAQQQLRLVAASVYQPSPYAHIFAKSQANGVFGHGAPPYIPPNLVTRASLPHTITSPPPPLLTHPLVPHTR